MSLLLALMLAQVEGQAFTSTAEVRACQPLADGRVLSATGGGLVLYGPGLEPERIWTVFDFLPGTDIRALAVSPDGESVWVGGEGGVALVRRDGTGGWQMEPFASFSMVSALLPTSDGGLLVGAETALVLLHGPAGQERSRHRLASRRSFVTSLAHTPSGVRVGTSGDGVWSWDEDGLRRVDASLPSPFVHTLGAAQERVLVGTVGGLAEVGRATPVSSAEVRALVRDQDAWLAGTMGEGLLRLDDAGNWRELPFPSKHVTALGRQGDTTCAGTLNGTYVRRGHRGEWRHLRVTGPPSNDISALALDGDRLWVGTFDRGLAVLEAGRFRTVNGVDDRVNALAVERRGGDAARTWVATARGLAIVDGGGPVVSVRRQADGLPADDVHAVAALRGGGVVVGTARGAAIVRGDRIQLLAKAGAPTEATWAVAEGADGSLWLGTTNGLYRHRPGARLQRFSVAGQHLWDNWVTSILLDGSSVWVGTYAGGVSHLVLGPRDSVEAEPWAGRAHVNPAGLSLSRGELWAATMEGASTMEGARSTSSSTPRVWRRSAGIAPGRDVTAVVHGRGWRWIASRQGLARWPLQ